MKHSILLAAALFFSCAINASIRDQQPTVNAELSDTIPHQVRITCPTAEGFNAIVTLDIVSSDGFITDADMAALKEHVCNVIDENPELVQEAIDE